MIYLIGSLRNPSIPTIANTLRSHRFDVFASWAAAGPHADDYWRDFERSQGYSYEEALQQPAAQHIFSFDRHWLDKATTAVLVQPAGKSGHLELGWALGRGKKGFILLDNPDRWDVMALFADGVTTDIGRLVEWLKISEQ